MILRLALILACACLIALAPLPKQHARAEALDDMLDTRTLDPHAAFKESVEAWREGRNVILASVDGEIITSELIRNEFRDQFASLVNSLVEAENTQIQREIERIKQANGGVLPKGLEVPVADAQRTEMRVLYSLARRYALNQLLLDIAAKANIPVSEARVRAYLAEVRELAGIDANDGEAWADFTLKRFGQTPEEYREKLKDEALISSVQELLVGSYGPIPVPPFPFAALSLDVTDEEMYERFLETQSTWKKLGSIDYSRISLEIPQSLPQADKQVLESAFRTQRERLLDELTDFDGMKAALDEVVASYEDQGVGVIAEANVEESREQEIGLGAGKLRALDAGEISEYEVRPIERDGESLTVIFLVILHEKEEGSEREYLDPFVQRSLEEQLKNEKRAANMKRVDAELFSRAVILPEGVFDLSEASLR